MYMYLYLFQTYRTASKILITPIEALKCQAVSLTDCTS